VAADVPDADGASPSPKALMQRCSSKRLPTKAACRAARTSSSISIRWRSGAGSTSSTPTTFHGKANRASAPNKRTGLFTGGGALLGTVLGAVAGGGTGAAIGAGAGAAAGAGVQTLTRGKAVRIPSETLLHFRLEAPASIRDAR